MKAVKPNPALNKHNHSSFSHSNTHSLPRNQIEPLTKQFFGRLVKLESDFHNKDYSLETLDELTQLYAVTNFPWYYLIRVIARCRILR